MPKPAYDHAYQVARKALLADGPVCVHCGQRRAIRADHQPPLSLHVHEQGSGCCILVPSCLPCEQRQAAALGGARPPKPKLELVEPPSICPKDPVWKRAVWLNKLRREIPEDATWPRLMSAPHPRAVGTLGVEVEAWAAERNGRPWRWWQRLAAYRMLEVDADGHLVWSTILLTVSRQLGKSWLVRDLCGWRLEAGARFGVEQLVVSIAKDVAAVKEVQRPARVRAKFHPDLYRVREVNGQEEIEYLPDASRWMIRSREGVYGLTATFATADEAWKIPANAIEDGLEPTMVEREDAQLVLLSTAHRRSTALMIGRRAGALDQLHDPRSTLLLEWSAPPDSDLEDRAGWRMASPHWTPRRELLIAERIAAALGGESDDPDEPDPVEAVKAQWLNRWPAKRVAPAKGEPLVDDDAWAAVRCDEDSVGPLVIAVEDHYGQGASVAFCGVLPDERLGVGGRLCASRADAYVLAAEAAEARPGSTLVVGASLSGDPALEEIRATTVVRAGVKETPPALAMLRDMVATGTVVHDGSPDLDDQMAAGRVRDGAGGLHLVVGPRSDLVRATVWALLTAVTSPAPSPAIH
jgi:hypothetical protein